MAADRFKIIHGPGEHLTGIEDNSVSLIIADGPYGTPNRRRRVRSADPRSPYASTGIEWADCSATEAIETYADFARFTATKLTGTGALAVMFHVSSPTDVGR